jgi:hypothetical protein
VCFKEKKRSKDFEEGKGKSALNTKKKRKKNCALYFSPINLVSEKKKNPVFFCLFIKIIKSSQEKKKKK